MEDVLWIAEAPDLIGDARLGDTDHQRFLPAQYDIKGNAIDLKGFPCQKLACPHCHLELPRSLLEMQPYFISVVGAPASGKSCFLTSMTWNLRTILPADFNVLFADADSEMNGRLQQYESMQFFNEDPNAIVKIEKTQAEGDQYKTVLINDQRITYLQPFLFSMCTSPDANGQRKGMTLTIYDNAGESYLPVRDGDTASLPVTRHLEQSNCIFFIFDPTQDIRFKKVCKNPTNDPQFRDDQQSSFTRSPLRQESVLGEMIKRTRTYMGLHSVQKYDRPLIIIVSKLDAWRDLLPDVSLRNPWARSSKTNTNVFLPDKVREVSQSVRALLKKLIPDMVSMVDQFASDVTFIPVSATGSPPIQDQATGNWGFKVNDIKPIWVEVPMLYALSQSIEGFFPILTKSSN